MIYNIFSLTSLVDYLLEGSISIYIFFFYILLVLLAVIFVYMLYVQYATTRKINISFKFFSVFIKAFNELLVPVLFIPFLNYFLSVLRCVNRDGVSIHFKFEEMTCFSGSHIIYTFFAVIGLIWFMILSIILSLTCYEIRINNTFYSAK